MGNTGLEVKHLSVEVRGVEVLHDVNLTIPKGEVHALFGHNASGKTTLMMCIMGYPAYQVVKGQVLYNGEDITGIGVTEIAGRGIGLLHQRPPTIAGVKLRELVDFVIEKAPEREQELEDLIKTFQMERFLDRDINSGLSGGEIKRSELLQLLITSPRLVIADEPDSGVDLEAMGVVGKMLNVLLSKESMRPAWRNLGLIVTHTGSILDYVFADKAHVMINGRIECTGNPHILLDEIRAHGYEECVRCNNRRSMEQWTI